MQSTTIQGNKPVWGVVLLFLFLGTSLLVVNRFGDRLVEGSRSHIIGEGYWSKAQSHAAYSLVNLIVTEDLRHYSEFRKQLDIVDAARQAREELSGPDPDYEYVRNVYIRAGHREEDVDELIWFYENFRNFPHFEQPINYWIEGEVLTQLLREIAEDALELSEQDGIGTDQQAELLERTDHVHGLMAENQQQLVAALLHCADWVSIRVKWINIGAVVILLLGAMTFLIGQLRLMRWWNQKILRSESKFKEVLTHSRDVIYRLNIHTGRYDYISPSVERITGYPMKEFLEGGIDFVLDITHPDDTRRMEEQVIQYDAKDAVDKLSQDSQFRIKRSDGKYIWINNKRSVLRDENGNPVAVIGNVRDISERKEYVEALDASLKEKDMLLSEIHHRVKNNLSIVSSLVELQKNTFTNGEGDGLMEIQSRIKSIALVHEKLYQNETFADVDLAEYVGDLAEMLITTFESGEKKISLNVDMDSLVLNIKKAVPLGLICNEVINNCYKYAFDGKESGLITIRLDVNESEAIFSIADDGVGMSDESDDEEATSLGMTLIRVLTKQIDGSLAIESEEGRGTRFEIEFSLSENES